MAEDNQALQNQNGSSSSAASAAKPGSKPSKAAAESARRFKVTRSPKDKAELNTIEFYEESPFSV